MNNTGINNDSVFDLLPLKAAKVSEISEATAAASVPPHERVNFHIGNPVQDSRLISIYLRMVLGLETVTTSEPDYENLLNQLDLETDRKNFIEFLHKTISQSAPYMPRGGFNINSPNKLIINFTNWLTRDQREPLSYDSGAKSGKRECILASGGIIETLRILFHALSVSLVKNEADIFLYEANLPSHTKNYNNLFFHSIPEKGNNLTEHLERFFNEAPRNNPCFLIIGELLNEQTRRRLRKMSLIYPLYFIEINDAPNHLSLAREALLMHRVLRIMTPAVFDKKLSGLSTVFLAGNSDYLKIFETIHFQLKGTPSASEIALLEYILENIDLLNTTEDIPNYDYSNLDFADTSNKSSISTSPLIEKFSRNYQSYVNRQIDVFHNIAENKFKHISEIVSRSVNTLAKKLSRPDLFLNHSTDQIFRELIANIYSPEFQNNLEHSFLTSFIKEHPEYEIEKSIVVSGSSRTALGLLGFSCGIKEVISCDLSWTYEHCFPNVIVKSLDQNYDLDTEGIITEVDKKILHDPHWKNKGAVVLNNPHNASGKSFSTDKVRSLIKLLMDRSIYIIDDLAYQNVMPGRSLQGPPTIKQIALDLLNNGEIYSHQIEKIISVHSLSKTDCFAGARLAVVEIPDTKLSNLFRERMSFIKPNIMALFLAYLFYRNDSNKIKNFWFTRNSIFADKMDALEKAVFELPKERNEFDIKINKPAGSMYPHLVIEKLPSGLSLDWLASGLAVRGIGLIPLSAFARTSSGFELARKSFRLTLGGTDSANDLLFKTRRVLIDLNKLIAEERSKYSRKEFTVIYSPARDNKFTSDSLLKWKNFARQTRTYAENLVRRNGESISSLYLQSNLGRIFLDEYLPERLSIFENLFRDNLGLANEFIYRIENRSNNWIKERLEKELYKTDLEQRQESFKSRLFDRTVHPTQMYSHKIDKMFYFISEYIQKQKLIPPKLHKEFAECFLNEFLGKNVSINSSGEADELVTDLISLSAAEDFMHLNLGDGYSPLLSFWGDWDGSSRPSGQGHRLVSAALLENVNQLAGLIKSVVSNDNSIKFDPQLLDEINQFPQRNKHFWKLLDEITSLTNQLEKRFRSVLPFSISSGRLRRAGMKLGIAKDPLTKLSQHNDSLERKMFELRKQRRERMEYFFSLNKRLRKSLYNNIPSLLNSPNKKILLNAVKYKDLLKRFVLTPRINQKLITVQDQFAIDTTVFNIVEINSISAKYGNPGMVLGLQVSMSDNPDALISLDRKLNSRRNDSLRSDPSLNLPGVWSIPLFEDMKTVSGYKCLP